MSPPTEKRDLFLSYHNPDQEAVATIKQLLQEQGLSTFLDRDHLVPGMPWPQALEDALHSARAVAVFLGQEGLGLWVKREMGLALDRQVQEEREGRSFPVIPVLLPGADPTPGFLFLNTWVDLRQNPTDPEALEAIVQAVRGNPKDPPPEPLVPFCPYRGLRAFHEEHAAFFCGRTAFIDQLFEMVLTKNLVAVIGPSGSGKSSVVQAGLIPRLRRQHSPHETWDTIVFTPGEHPFHRLAEGILPLLEPRLTEREQLKEARSLGTDLQAGTIRLEQVLRRALKKSEGTDNFLLVVDQFEEILTLSSEQNQKLFIEHLMEALEHPGLTITLTLRGDFYGEVIGKSRVLSDQLQTGIINLGPMREEELLQALIDPARRVGLSFEKGLAETILQEVGDEPGKLPLLEFALSELWRKREGTVLTFSGYQTIGRVAGALSMRAEAEFNKFSKSQQEFAQQIFTRLVRVSSPGDGGKDTRRRIALTDLHEEAKPIVQALADARMLVTFGDVSQRQMPTEPSTADPPTSQTADIEVAHEALIAGWTRLQQWVNQDREFLLWIQRLRLAKNEWQRTKKDPGTLLRGAPLTEAESWLNKGRQEEVNQSELQFIQDSINLRQRKLEHTRLRQALTIGGLVLAIGIITTIASIAVQERNTALSRELAANAMGLLGIDPELSILLASKAIQQSPTNEAKDVLKQALRESSIRHIYRRHQGETHGAWFSPNGMLIASAGEDGMAKIWEVGVDPEVTNLQHKHSVLGVEFSPDNHRVMTRSLDTIGRIWNLQDPTHPTLLEGHTGPITDAQYSHNGELVITGSLDATSRIWNARTGARLQTLIGHTQKVTSASFSPNDQFAVTSSEDGTVIVWRTTTGEPLQTLKGHSEPVWTASFNSDGTQIVTASQDRTIRVWATSTGKLLTILKGHLQNVFSASFSPNDQHILTTSQDQTIRVWKAASGQPLAILDGHSGHISQAVFDPNGHWIASASFDGTARLWDARTGHQLSVLKGHRGRVNSIAFHPDGKTVVTTGRDQTVRIWNARTSKIQQHINTNAGPVYSVSLHPSGSSLLTSIGKTAPQIWDLHTLQPSHTVSGHAQGTTSATYSANGQRFLTSDRRGHAHIWDNQTKEKLATFITTKKMIVSAAFSPNGQKIVAAGQDGHSRVWDVTTQTEVLTLTGHAGAVLSAAFSPDGKEIVTTGQDGTGRIWDSQTGETIRELTGHTNWVYSGIFSPDGKYIATASADKTALIWAAKSGELIRELRGHTARVYSATFSPNGQYIVTASEDGTARVWETETGEWLDELRSLAGGLNHAIFTTNGQQIVTAGDDGSIQFHQFETRNSISGLLNLAQHRVTRTLTSTEQEQYLSGSEQSPIIRFLSDLFK